MITAGRIFKGIWIGVSAILGFTLGIVIGWIYVGIIILSNHFKKRIKLSTSLRRTLKDYYPSIDPDKVRIISSANGILYGKTGLTQGNEIFFKCTFSENNIDNLKLLLHELVHVKQYTKYGMWKFYILYAYGYIKKMFSYRNIPMEVEAFDYTDSIFEKFLAEFDATGTTEEDSDKKERRD